MPNSDQLAHYFIELKPRGGGVPQSLPADMGNKAKLLYKAARAGLTVPSGKIILSEMVSESDTIDHLRERAIIDRPAAVRSAFSAEDSADQSLAGFFHSELFVPPAEQWAAVQRVIDSAAKRADLPDIRRDVLVMEMVDAEIAGVAFIQTDFADDLVNFTRGTADKLVSGETAGARVNLPRLALGRYQPPLSSGESGPHLQRLQRLLAQIREVFGDKDWDIEWADDGQTCWLIQIRPITVPPRRNEAFTYANIREIMPDPPSVFMSEIVAASATDLFAYYRSFDRTLPTKRPLIEMFEMRPLFNISLLTDMMRWWGLPTRLVTNSIGGEADQETGLNLGRFLRKSPVLIRQGIAQFRAVGSSKRATKEIYALVEETGDTLPELAETLRQLFVQLVSEMFNLTAALSGPLLILRLTDTLTAHNSRNRTVTTEMYTDLQPLRQMVQANRRWIPILNGGDVPDDPAFQEKWNAWITKHGNRGVYESDIARPRYHEMPEPILMSLTHQIQSEPKRSTGSLMELLTWPVWAQCRRVLIAREWWRYHAMHCYDRLRQKMLARAADLVESGQLPTPEHLFRLTPAEWADLEAGKRFDDQFWDARSAQETAAKAYDFPDLLYRFDDLDQFLPGNRQFSASDRLKGVSLTTGTRSGRAWILSEPASTLPDGFEPEDTILVARSVDAGWIPTFSLVAGVVVEIGGDLSHGSIILREVGLPAITNVQHATRHFQTGDRVVLKAGNGIVERGRSVGR